MKRHFDKETLIIRTEFDKQKRSINDIKRSFEEYKKADLTAKVELNEKLEMILRKIK